MKFKILAVLTVCVAMLVAGVACNGSPAMKADAIVLNMLAVYGQGQVSSPDVNISHIDVTSAHIEANMTLVARFNESAALNEWESPMLAFTMTTVGDIDTKNKSMLVVKNISEVNSPERLFAKIYVTDGWTYVGVPSDPVKNDGPIMLAWSKYELTDYFWSEMQEEFYSYRDLFIKYSKVELIGTETLDGIECWKIELEPDMTQLRDWLYSQGESEYSLDWFFPVWDAKDVKATSWIAKDTYYEVRFSMDAGIDTSDEEDDVSLVMRLIIEQSQFNMPVIITLPPEAKNAKID